MLSHPAATDAVMRRVFGDVHMLSHMVGAANRADIRRLRQLEEDNAALSAKLEAQQRQLRDGFTARDDKIRLLNEALSRALAQAPVQAGHESDDLRAAKDALIDLDRRLSREIAHRKRLESRVDAATLAQSQAERARQDAARECEDLRRELALVEAQINGWLGEDASAAPDLGGAQVLYVGGRANQVPQLKAVVERAGGAFLHHDGGIEHSMTLLPGLIGRADLHGVPDRLHQPRRHGHGETAMPAGGQAVHPAAHVEPRLPAQRTDRAGADAEAGNGRGVRCAALRTRGADRPRQGGPAPRPAPKRKRPPHRCDRAGASQVDRNV